MTQNWLGFNVDFNNVDEKTSDGGFELLKEGKYRATIKSVNKSVLGSKNKQALTVTMILDDFGSEITHNLFLPENGDSESAIKFKNENLKNFFTRFVFRQLTKEEFDKIDKSVVNAELQKIMSVQPNFVGAKVLVHLKQEPFISRDSNTRAINWTNAAYNPNELPQAILKIIQAEEQKGVEFKQLPLIMFSNKVTAFGFGFYNDFDETAELKDSKAYNYIQSLGAVKVEAENQKEEVPQY